MDILKNVIKPIFTQIKKFMSEEMHLELKNKNIHLQKLQKPILKDVSAFITIKELKITLLISYDYDLIEYLTDKILIEELNCFSEDDKREYIKSVACEVVNIVIGNAIEFFPKELQHITITTPHFTEESECKYKFKYSLSTLIKTNYRDFSINYLKG